MLSFFSSKDDLEERRVRDDKHFCLHNLIYCKNYCVFYHVNKLNKKIKGKSIMSPCKYISEKIKRWDKSKLKVLWLVNFAVSRSKIKKKKKRLWHVREVLTLLRCHVLLLFWVKYCQFLVPFTDWFCFFSYVNESEGKPFLICL